MNHGSNDQAPVLLARTGDREVTALTYGQRDETWTPLSPSDSGVLGNLLQGLQSSRGSGRQVAT
jgi:hypothetical protein